MFNLFVCFSSKLDGCLVALVHNDNDADDEESLLLWKQLCYVAHMELHVRGLSSGYCKDVHGQVSGIKPMSFLYKRHGKNLNRWSPQDDM